MDQDKGGNAMGSLIYVGAYSVATVVLYIAEHVSQGIAAARNSSQARKQTSSRPALASSSNPDCTERLLLQLETIIMEMISAARANDLGTLHERAKLQLKIVRQLQVESTWPPENIFTFLKTRGRIDLDGADFEEMRRKVQQAESVHGLLAA